MATAIFDGHAGRRDGREKAQNQRNAAEELGKRRDVAQPVRQAHVGHDVGEAVERPTRNHLHPAMGQHDRAQNQAADQGHRGPHPLHSRYYSMTPGTGLSFRG